MDESSTQVTRREFARGSLALLGLGLARCAGPAAATRPTASPAGPAPVYRSATATTFPLYVVRGTPYEMGRAIGQRFAPQIRGGFEARAEWWRELKAFAQAQPKSVHETFVAAARKHAPHIVEELRGWADGCGLPLYDLMVLNLKAEYAALKDKAEAKPADPPPGCSTVVFAGGNGFILAHNEDGDAAYEQRMFMLQMQPEGKPSVLCASYPGILPGNAPWINDAGVIMTTNFIYTKEVRLGVGRYFLDRLAMEARSIDEALRICAHPERAYAFHHVIGAVGERRAVSLEVTPSAKQRVDIEGLFLHTNHLIHEPLARAAQDPEYVGSSSMTRWQVLSRWKASLGEKPYLTAADVVRALSSHEGKPYSPCRHPEGKVTGSTLLTAVFEVPGTAMRVYKNQPCGNRVHDYRAATPAA